VTTDRARALYYARAATAFAITPTNFDGYWPPQPVDLYAPPTGDPVGLIVTAEVPGRLLKDDPYNPTDEPDQYRIYGGITPEQIVDFEEVEFPELLDQEQRVTQFVLWTSI
jgi:hypothetical protein